MYIRVIHTPHVGKPYKMAHYHNIMYANSYCSRSQYRTCVNADKMQVSTGNVKSKEEGLTRKLTDLVGVMTHIQYNNSYIHIVNSFNPAIVT